MAVVITPVKAVVYAEECGGSTGNDRALSQR